MTALRSLFADGFPDTYSYEDFRVYVTRLLAEGKVTGHIQSEAYLEYTRLNETRMNRWEKHFSLRGDMLEAASDIKGTYTWLVITEGWCGDSAQSLPVIQKLAAATPRISLRVILRDDHPEIMDLFLTNGKRSIPKLVCLDAAGNVVFEWGSMPSALRSLVNEWKAQSAPEISTAELKERIHLWYARDKGNGIQDDLLPLVRSMA